MMEKIHDRNALHYSKTQTHPASEENRHELCRNTKLSGIITDKCYSKWIFEEVHMQRLRTFYKYLLHFSVFLDKRVQTNRPLSFRICLDRQDSPLLELQLGTLEPAVSDDQHPFKIIVLPQLFSLSVLCITPLCQTTRMLITVECSMQHQTERF